MLPKWLKVALGAGGVLSDAFAAALSRFSIGPSATGWCSQGCHGIVDTGTFLLTIPGQYMSDFLQALGVQEDNDGVGGKGAPHTRGADAGRWGHIRVVTLSSGGLPAPLEQNISPETTLLWERGWGYSPGKDSAQRQAPDPSAPLCCFCSSSLTATTSRTCPPSTSPSAEPSCGCRPPSTS